MTLVLFAVSVFLMMSFTGDPVFMVIPQSNSTTARMEQARQFLALDSSLLRQYFIFLTNLLEGDFGRSYVFRQPAMDLILKFPAQPSRWFSVAIASRRGGSLGSFLPAQIRTGLVFARPVRLLGTPIAQFVGGHDADLLLLSAVSAPASGRGETIRVSGAPPVDPDRERRASHIILPAVTLALATLAVVLLRTLHPFQPRKAHRDSSMLFTA